MYLYPYLHRTSRGASYYQWSKNVVNNTYQKKKKKIMFTTGFSIEIMPGVEYQTIANAKQRS